MTSTGAGTPVQSSNDAAPCATSTSRPSTTVAPGGRAAAACAVSRRRRGRQVDEGLARARLDEQLVPHGRRVHDEVGARSRPAASRRCARRPRPWRRATRAPRATRPPRRRRRRSAAARAAGGRSRAAASVLEPSTRPSRNTSVFTDSTPASTSSQSATTASLCGVVTFAPAKPSATRPRTASSSRVGRDVERHVGPVERERREGGVLHPRRERVRPGARAAPTSVSSRIGRPITQRSTPRYGRGACRAQLRSRSRTRRPWRRTPTRSP